MSLQKSYEDHLKIIQARTESALARCQYESLIISAGSPFLYFQDDQYAPFRSNPYFAYWCPYISAHHLLVIRPAKRPLLLYYYPNDYWEEFKPAHNEDWAPYFEIENFTTKEDVWKAAAKYKNAAFIGSELSKAQEYGFDTNPTLLINLLNWERKGKTPYEVSCIKEANKIAAKGHKVAKDLFLQGKTEKEIYWAYAASIDMSFDQVGYEPIIALNQHGAILHYNSPKHERVPNKVLLIDAGAQYRRYNSDITRTWCADGAVDEFKDLVAKVDAAQQQLCALLKPGFSYIDMQVEAAKAMARILCDLKIIVDTSPEEAFESKLVDRFFPHGIGHPLGIQVHDVADKQIDPEGQTFTKSARFPNLRCTGVLAEDNVLTVEPGIYFSPALLDGIRASEKRVNWTLVDRLQSHGGVRIEDNLLVRKSGAPENLTRPYLVDL